MIKNRKGVTPFLVSLLVIAIVVIVIVIAIRIGRVIATKGLGI